MVVAAVRIELHVPGAQSLKDRRSVLNSLKDRLRGRFNVAVGEAEPSDLWQRASLGLAAVGSERAVVDGMLEDVVNWLRRDHAVTLIRVEQER